MRLLLASGSTTRRRMLEDAGVPFEAVAPELDEEAAKADLIAAGEQAIGVARGLAERKALSVTAGPHTLILGSDQVLEQADGSLLSKARSREEAAAQLHGLAGAMHRLHSAAALVHAGELVWQEVETVRLTMRPLSADFLAEYLDREWEQVRWNVGVYRIECLGVQLFERIEGSHFAILGMPLLPLLAELRRRGVLTS